MELTIGKIYEVNHQRKGNFTAQITDQDDEFAYGIIRKGNIRAMNDYNQKTAGDEISFRKSFCTFKEI